ncbi:energy transducer TonB family protein [Sphingopyxis fribergensis]
MSPASAMLAAAADTKRLSTAAIVSLAVHGGVGAALFLGLADATPAAPPPAAMVVELAELPSAPPVPPTEAPPQPEQTEAQPKPVVSKVKLPPIPKLAFNVTPDVAVPLKDIADPNKKQAEKPAEETTKAAAPFAERKDAPKAPSMGVPSNANPQAEANWEAKVLGVFNRKKRYPSAAQSGGQEDRVFVRITVDREGRVLSSAIRKSRGYALLDSEVASLAKRVSPLPKPPKEIMESPVTLLIPVEFFITKK